MKNIKNILQLFLITFSVVVLQSCREDVVEATELDRTTIYSYETLFNSFWDTMNNDYNYFNEQEESWDDVYREYNPKFKALTTFGRTDVDPALAEKEANLAFKYFAEMISDKKLLDQHFLLKVTIPAPSIKNSGRTATFEASFVSNMKYLYTEEDGFLNLGRTNKNPRTSPSDVSSLMIDEKLDPATVIQDGPLLAGYLKDEPKTMYVQLTSFQVYPITIINEVLAELTDISNFDEINQSFYEDFKKLDNEKGTEYEALMKANFDAFKALIANVIASEEYKNYLAGIEKFKNTELIDDFEASLLPLANFVEEEKQDFATMDEELLDTLIAYFTDPDTSQAQKDGINLLYGVYNKRIGDYKIISGFENETTRSFLGLAFTIDVDFDELLIKFSENYALDLYSKLYNPLTNGEPEKIILDFRGNGGGYVIDARLFTERFVTKNATWAYQRTKEGNGRFNYTPWTPVETSPHDFALKEPVPTAILIDQGSFSMGEISTLIIKSQGDHVTIVGDYSGGGTAGLGGQDSFNGGNRLNNNYLDFYMPLMAFKDANGEIVEGTGIKPDVLAIPTQEQINEYNTTGYDPALEAALKAVNK